MESEDFYTFLTQWVDDEIPACDVGMSFLKCVSDEFGREIFWDNWNRYLRDEPVDVVVLSSICWQRFLAHDSCGKCDEA